MTWPTDDLTNTHLDAPTDDPSLGRAELNSLLLKVKAILAEVQAGATVYSTANLPSSEIVIPSGTKMLFQQTDQPSGWSKLSTYNDRALRVVSGTAGAGGSSTFSATFHSGRTTDSQGDHVHVVGGTAAANSPTSGAGIQYGAEDYCAVSEHTHIVSGTAALNGAHTHLLSIAVQYVDVIICQKN